MYSIEWETIEKRISCRAYKDQLLDEETLQKLSAYIQQLNEESGLHFQLFSSKEPGRPAIKPAAAMFSGNVYTYAALVAGDDPLSAEKTGYYGQKLVLYATQLGLGTCWVAGTYDKKSISPDVAEGEKVWDVILIGYATEKMPLKQKMIRAGIRKKDRRIEQFLESDQSLDSLPLWLQKAVKAVQLGPSAVNQQPVNIVYKDGRILAKLWKSGHGLEYNDLGIAKCQFEAGAAAHGVNGTWKFGDAGEFLIRQA